MFVPERARCARWFRHRQGRQHGLRALRSHEPRYDRHPRKDQPKFAPTKANSSARSRASRRSNRPACIIASPEASPCIPRTQEADDGVGRREARSPARRLSPARSSRHHINSSPVRSCRPQARPRHDRQSRRCRSRPGRRTARTPNDTASERRIEDDQRTSWSRKQHYEDESSTEYSRIARYGDRNAKRSAVRVATDMNFDAGSDRDRRPYAPARHRPLDSKPNVNRTPGHGYGARQPPVGVPGTTTNNVPTYQGQQQNASGNEQVREVEIARSTTTSPRSNSKHIDAPGKVTRLRR